MTIRPEHRRWLQSAPYYTGRPALLAKDDPDPAARTAALEQVRSMYAYNYAALPPLPLLTEVPQHEHFAEKYLLGRTERTAVLLPNAAAWKLHLVFNHFNRLDDFKDMYPLLPEPAVLPHWRNDSCFAEQRLSGPNPMELSRVTHADQIPFTLPGADARIGSGRLYMTDYRALSFIGGGTTDHGVHKHMPTPVGLFEVNAAGKLMPVAIKLHDDTAPLLRESAGDELWLVAKICLQVADANHHEMVTHLAHTHLAMEPFAIAANRQLADTHPVAVLLRPHFRFLLTNNALGLEKLLNEGGIVDHLLAGTLAESLKMVTDACQQWRLKDAHFEHNIQARGVDDAALLPKYAWRDDARLLWDAIGRYVRSYLALYYTQPADVGSDAELQAWAAELAAADGGRIRDMPARIETSEQLADILQTLIFTLGPQHSAVNFAQWDYFGFVPNAPLALYRNPRGVAERIDLMKMLPPQSLAEQQLEAADELTAYRFDKLGHYDSKAMTDPRAIAVVERFQAELASIETEIDQRNQQRALEYPFLKPSLVLNSPSI